MIKLFAIIKLTFITSLLFYTFNAHGQSVTLLPGETAIDYSGVYTGDGFSSGTSCHFNKGKGLICIGIEVQVNNGASYLKNKIAFKYNGTWHQIATLYTDTSPTNEEPKASFNRIKASPIKHKRKL